jgi:5-methylcytosine-specific restriction endonuclease McrA
VAPPRRTWATPECIDRVRLRCDWAFVRKHVYELSRGLCAVCGCHAESLRAQVRESLLEGDRAVLTQALAAGWPRLGRVWYEIDHIKPVAEGGHEAGRANLRVLCYRCHVALTRAQNRGRKKTTAA